MPETVLDRVRVVLVEPLDPVNIAATARAMKNMGVSSLVLVRPVAYESNRIEGVAHDTHDIVERIRHVESVDDALQGCVYVASYTARRRAAKWATLDPRTSGLRAIEAAREGDVAIVFGREDYGLANDVLDRSHAVVTIPTTSHSSLNLAQAVLVALYELHSAAGDATRVIPPPRKDAPAATHEQSEEFFTSAEDALRAIDFFKTHYPELIMRTVRSLTLRAAPDGREIGLMRAIAIEVVKALRRRERAP
jgi:TrmH family RNA methyltransferase